MSVSMNSGAAAVSAKHRNAERSVRVLGQTAAVAGISGALLLALKAMVLVSPAVMPGSAGLDALGPPNAVAPLEAPAAPVTFELASASTPIVDSERTVTPTVTLPTTTTKPVVTNKPSTRSTPSTPSTPSAPAGPSSNLGDTTKPVTDLVDGLLPGVGSTVAGVVDTVGVLVDNLIDTVNGTTGNLLKPVTDTLGVGSSSEADQGLLPQVGGLLDDLLG